MTGWLFQIFFIFTPNLGEDVQFDEHIFQMGRFNHQPDDFQPVFFGSNKKWRQDEELMQKISQKMGGSELLKMTTNVMGRYTVHPLKLPPREIAGLIKVLLSDNGS